MNCEKNHPRFKFSIYFQATFICWLTFVVCGFSQPSLAQTTSPLENEAKQLEQQGNEYYNAFNYAAAIPLLEKSIDLSLRANVPLTAAYTRHILAFAQLASGNKTAALYQFEENLRFHQTRKDNESTGHYLFYAAQIYIDLNDNEKALSYLNEARKLAAGNQERQAEIDQLRITTLNNLGDRSTAEEIVEDARADYSKDVWQKYLGASAAELNIPYEVQSSKWLIWLSALAAVLLIILLFYAGYRLPWLRKRLPEFFLVVIALGISLLIAEMSLRFWFNEKTADDVSHFLHRPNQVTHFFPKQGVMPGVSYKESTFTTNDAGLRGDPLPDGNSYRIMTIGGSSTEVLYLDDKDAWPNQLQQELSSQLRRKIWVGNAGKSGLNTFSHVTQMYFAIPEIKPDLVVVTAGINDLNQCISGGLNAVIDNAERIKKPNFVFDYAQHVFDRITPSKRDDSQWRLISLTKQLVSSSPTVVPAKNKVIQDEAGLFYIEQRLLRQEAEKIDQPPSIGTCLLAFEENLKKIVRLGKKSEIPVIFLTQGALYRENLTAEEEKLLWFGSAGSNAFGKSAKQYYSSKAMDQLLNAYNSTTLSVCRSENIPCWDADNALPQTIETYYDDVHFNVAGSRNMAAKLATFLKPILSNK